MSLQDMQKILVELEVKNRVLFEVVEQLVRDYAALGRLLGAEDDVTVLRT